jgi:nucleotide-binding universal stress UspA family protein
MTDDVLVPMDGSPLSKRALAMAIERFPDARIRVLHVIDPTQPGYSYPLDADTAREPLHGSEAWYERSRELADDLFAEVRDVAAEAGGDPDAVETETEVGEAARAIVDYVEREGIDHVVIGSHGRDEEARVLLGGVSESVAFRSPVPVTLVR